MLYMILTDAFHCIILSMTGAALDAIPSIFLGCVTMSQCYMNGAMSRQHTAVDTEGLQFVICEMLLCPYMYPVSMSLAQPAYLVYGLQVECHVHKT